MRISVKLAVDYNANVETSRYEDNQLTINPKNQQVYIGKQKAIQGLNLPVYIPYTNMGVGYIGIGTDSTRDEMRDSISIGYGSTVSDYGNTAVGTNASAETYSTAVGYSCTAEQQSTSFGYSSIAYNSSTSLGYDILSDQNSISIGYGISARRGNICIGESITVDDSDSEYGRIFIGHAVYPQNNDFFILVGTETRQTSIPGRRIMALSDGSNESHNQVEISDTTIRLIDSNDNIYDIRDEINNAYATWEVID